VYGERQESSDVGGVVSIFSRNLIEGKPIFIHGDGTQERSFTYVKDVVQANLRAASTQTATGQVYNCASGIKVTINELADLVAKEVQVNNPRIIYDEWLPGDIKIFNIDNCKIIRDLKIDFLTDFQAGLRKTVAWSKNFFSKTN
jgi:nucleoside-diphosphate-sugar epimerase